MNPSTRDTGAMLYKLSYEATDVGSRSIVGSYVPVREMSVKGAVSRNSAKLGNYKMPVKLRET